MLLFSKIRRMAERRERREYKCGANTWRGAAKTDSSRLRISQKRAKYNAWNHQIQQQGSPLPQTICLVRFELNQQWFDLQRGCYMIQSLQVIFYSTLYAVIHTTHFLTMTSLSGHPTFCIPAGRQKDGHFLSWTRVNIWGETQPCVRSYWHLRSKSDF